jgi:methionyl-tRNA synthetase
VFYVWFDAPIGYISITADYLKVGILTLDCQLLLCRWCWLAASAAAAAKMMKTNWSVFMS